MRLLPTNKTDTQIILLLLALIMVPFLTTFLLDWSLIARNLARVILVYLLMIIEIAIIILSLKDIINTTSKK